MKNHKPAKITPGTSNKSIKEGYHNGSGIVKGDSNLVPGNIKKDVQIFGVTGRVIEATGDATAANVLAGKTFSNTAILNEL